jgi:site-specific recombinase
MRSQNTDNPVYKEANSEYIKYDNNDIGFTWYKDQSPKKGTTRYRICAITKASDGYHRYCSKEVKKITVTSSETYKEEMKKEGIKKEKITTLTDTQKTVLDQLAADFLKKLDEKYSTDSSKKRLILGNVVSQLANLGRKQVKMKIMVTYLVEKLEATLDPLEEIKNILKVE